MTSNWKAGAADVRETNGSVVVPGASHALISHVDVVREKGAVRGQWNAECGKWNERVWERE